MKIFRFLEGYLAGIIMILAILFFMFKVVSVNAAHGHEYRHGHFYRSQPPVIVMPSRPSPPPVYYYSPPPIYPYYPCRWYTSHYWDAYGNLREVRTCH